MAAEAWRADKLGDARCAAAARDSGSRDARAGGDRAASVLPASWSRRSKSPSAASPIVPVTTTRSPGAAPARRSHLAVRHRAEGRDRDRHRTRRAHGVAAEQRTTVTVRVLAEPAGERREPRFADLLRQCERRAEIRSAARLWRRDRRGSRATPSCAIASGGSSGKKCTPATRPSDGEHEIAARGRLDRRGIVKQTEGAGMLGERAEIALDQAILAGSCPPSSSSRSRHPSDWPVSHQRSKRLTGHCQLARANSSARNCRASWSSTALTMPVSSRSTKALATSTYSATTTRAGTSLR